MGEAPHSGSHVATSCGRAQQLSAASLAPRAAFDLWLCVTFLCRTCIEVWIHACARMMMWSDDMPMVCSAACGVLA